jgi:hypothetical protein
LVTDACISSSDLPLVSGTSITVNKKPNAETPANMMNVPEKEKKKQWEENTHL